MKKKLLLLLMVVLAAGICSAQVWAYSVNTDSNVDSPDGKYSFIGDGDIYDYESYLQYENNPSMVGTQELEEAPYCVAYQLWGGENGSIGRLYEVTLPDDGKLKIDVTSDDITHMGVDVFKGGDAIYEWTAVASGSSLSFSKTTEALPKGTYTVRFDYVFNNVQISDRVTRPDFYDGPGKRFFYHSITYIKAPYVDQSGDGNAISKAANPLKVKGRTAIVKRAKVKKKAQKLAVSKVIKFTRKGQGTMSYKLLSAKKGKRSFKKYFKISIKTGQVTVKKGLKKGTYKVKIKIRAAGNSDYKSSGWKTVTATVRVK